MKRMNSMIVVIAVLCVARIGLSNMPPSPAPAPPAPEPALLPHLTVLLDPQADASSVTIPAAASAAATDAQPPSFARFQTVVAGGMIAMAIAAGGLWLIRRRGEAGAGMR